MIHVSDRTRLIAVINSLLLKSEHTVLATDAGSVDLKLLIAMRMILFSIDL